MLIKLIERTNTQRCLGAETEVALAEAISFEKAMFWGPF